MRRGFYSSVKTGRWRGVVTTVITMSNIKDEIDWDSLVLTQPTVRPTFSGRETSVSLASIADNTCPYETHILPANRTQGEVIGNISDTYSNYHAFTVEDLAVNIPGALV